jgi:hypothetical protein
MAQCNRESFLDDEFIQDLHADRLSDAPSDCESDKIVLLMMTMMILDPQRHRKAEKCRGCR